MPADPTELTPWATLAGSLISPSVVVWLFVTGRIVRGSELTGAQETIKAKDVQLDAARDALMEKAIPVLTKAITVMESYQIEDRVRKP